jgi:uncharacterized hydrophobic protein (TIGR00271 family)
MSQEGEPGPKRPPLRRLPDNALASLWQYIHPRLNELTPEERRHVLAQLFYEGELRKPYLYRFFTLLSLSVGIASFGLLTDSTAVVIGAMLVAPLMTPIQASAASIVMGWERRRFNSLLLVGAGALWSIALSFGLGWLAPDRVTLPGEILARTSPTLLDLGIALAAGAAGAYTIVRQEASAIPGVAIAVALVPPLAVVGLTLENGQPGLANGAALLFLTNLAAIILAASIVLFVTGFSPRALLQRNWSMVRRGVFTSIIAVVLVSIPLGLHTRSAILDARDQHAIEDAIDDWLTEDQEFDVGDVDIDGHHVDIDLVGPFEPTGLVSLRRDIIEQLGDDATVSVRWIQRHETFVNEES